MFSVGTENAYITLGTGLWVCLFRCLGVGGISFLNRCNVTSSKVNRRFTVLPYLNPFVWGKIICSISGSWYRKSHQITTTHNRAHLSPVLEAILICPVTQWDPCNFGGVCYQFAVRRKSNIQLLARGRVSVDSVRMCPFSWVPSSPRPSLLAHLEQATTLP